jgi:hypothetical protein
MPDLAAGTILAEIGADMRRFPTAGHQLSWVACARKRTKAPENTSHRLCAKGPPWLKTPMVKCGFAAACKKGSYDKAPFNRLRGRHGAKKAIWAVAAAMFAAIDHMLKNGTEHQDPGANLRSPLHRGQSQASGRPDCQARLPGRASPAARGSMTPTRRPWFLTRQNRLRGLPISIAGSRRQSPSGVFDGLQPAIRSRAHSLTSRCPALPVQLISRIIEVGQSI